MAIFMAKKLASLPCTPTPHGPLILRGIHKCLYLVVLLTELVKTSVPHELGLRCYLVKPNLNSNVLSLNKNSCRAESTC